jgi:hypothetical protein
MNGHWAIWPDRVFVSYDKMRMRLHDDVANGDLHMTHQAVDELSDDDLTQYASDHWTFSMRKPSNKYETIGDDFDYSMNY